MYQKALTVLVAILFANTLSAQVADWKTIVSSRQILAPFWKADTIVNEAVQPIKAGGALPSGKLLFRSKKILSVKDTYLQIEYRRGKDWKYKNGQLIIPKGSSIPFYTADELVFSERKKDISLPGKKENQFVLFSEGGLLQSRQLAVTYIRQPKSQWTGNVPTNAEQQLPNTFEKLKNNKPVSIVFYGNSIETGANSSITLGQSPYLPTWPELVVENLKNHYSGVVLHRNNSKGGMLAKWGAENADSLVGEARPDLVIIGFGMNDGTSKIAPEVFISQLRQIISSVRGKNPSCEFILIATMLANPDAIHSQIQKEYRQPLLDMESTGIAIADITSIHETLLQYKSYQDMTGNNINHPNDYLARWYAQVISAMLLP